MPQTPPDQNRTDPQAHPQRLRVAHLNPNAATPFLLRPDGETRAAIAAELGVEALPKLEFRGEVRPEGAQGWRLDGQLAARVTQACVVTLKPVRSEIGEAVRLRYSPHIATPEGDEVEMGDETLEPLGAFIDLTAAMIEALALALPAYPRAEGAELATPEDVAEPAEDTRRPFAGLDKLLKRDG
ncbi:YceD family protein [Paracoccus sp. NSM]|uniref:YceD family protein n=1 Tax=Paracoccus sp. NSM TaxID=3457784 RepID=UPI004036B083